MAPAPAPDPDRPLVVPLVAGVLALVGGFLALVSLLLDYYEGAVPFREVPGQRWFFLVFGMAVIGAGVMLVAQRRTQLVGAAALTALAVTFIGARGSSIYNVSRAGDPTPAGPGFWLDLIGFLLVVVAAVFAVVGILSIDVRARRLVTAPERTRFALFGACVGFVLAVGYGLNVSRPEADPEAGTAVATGSPLVPSARSLWTQLIVLLALVALPPLVALTRRQIAAGLAIGVVAFVVAETLRRLLTSYGQVQGADTGRVAVEGTWAFLVGGIVLVALLAVRFVTLRTDEAEEKSSTRESARAA